jgi:tRNA(fMet)-specific endonuclease VapC
MKFLLDTDTCIHLLKKHPKTLTRFRVENVSNLGISSVTVFELLAGVEKCENPQREQGKLDMLRAGLQTFDFDEAAAAAAAKVRAALERKGQVIGPYDTLLAGHALELGCTMVTHNLREFKRVPGLKVEDWVT